MAVVFCCPFDSDLISCSSITPTGDALLDTTRKKFGAGSVSNDGWDFDLKWAVGAADAAGDEGSIGLWYKPGTLGAGTSENWTLVIRDTGSNQSRISFFIGIDIDAATIDYVLQMYTTGGTRIINLRPTESVVLANTFYYFEVNWKWNDAGGNTEITRNGTVITSDNAGNGNTRDAADINQIWFFGSVWDSGDFMNIDDLTLTDTRLHVGGYTTPTVPNCVCGGAPTPKRPFTLGSPFGMNPLGN
jgi:hypothetical protein